MVHVTSGFRRDVPKICALLGYYAALGGSSLPRFRDNLSMQEEGLLEFLDSKRWDR
jgi:hypothetical protein